MSVLDQRRQVVEDLTGELQGEIRCDTLTTSMYATDASLHEVTPLGVAFPKTAEDVVTLARYAREHRIPIVPRGAGTGLAGESLGEGLIIDFSRHMRAIVSSDDETVTVQPGVVCQQLNLFLAEKGRYFPPDPSGARITTLGSMLALDAAGSHAIRVGSTRDHVVSIDCVLTGGDAFTAGIESLRQILEPNQLFPPPRNRKQQILVGLRDLLSRHSGLIAERQPPLLRNRFGYMLRGVLNNAELQLPRLLVGSEGTLALFTAAKLHTSVRPSEHGVVFLTFGQLETAARAVGAISELDPSACDFMDRRLLSLAREANPLLHDMIPSWAEAGLLVEHTGADSAQVKARLQLIVDSVRNTVGNEFSTRLAQTPSEAAALRSLPETVVPMLSRMAGPARPLPFIEDAAVPPEVLPELVLKLPGVFQKHRVTATMYAHAATGQLHLRPILPPPTPESSAALLDLAADFYDLILSAGGTVCGEHGAGYSRSMFLERQYGPLVEVFRDVKRLFDPDWLLNPGKVLSTDPESATRHLRPESKPPESSEPVALQLTWTPAEMAAATDRCNGCGVCRTQSAETRMCPLFRLDPSEEAAPRSKANLMRRFASGRLSAADVATPEFKRIADLCFNCKQCERECPSNVSIPHLMIEAKAQYVATHGLTRAQWLLSRANLLGSVGNTLSAAMNAMLGSPFARLVLERLTGISRQRKLPRFARRSFLRLAKHDVTSRPRRAAGAPPAIYFVDHYANSHDPQLARAFIEVLRHNRIPVHVPPRQQPSGMAFVSLGDIEAARDVAETNLSLLADFARDGSPIVCTEPAAAVCLKMEYPRITSHPDADVVAERVIDASSYLLELFNSGRLKEPPYPVDLHVGYHQPCHVRTFSEQPPAVRLLSLIRGLRIHKIEKGCSGMAGTFGLCQETFSSSVRIGWELISRMRSPDLQVGVTECSSCKMQMEQGTTTPTVHPIKLLALAYGLMPELQSCLKPNRHRLLVT